MLDARRPHHHHLPAIVPHHPNVSGPGATSVSTSAVSHQHNPSSPTSPHAAASSSSSSSSTAFSRRAPTPPASTPKLALRRVVAMLARTTLRTALRNPYPYRRTISATAAVRSPHISSHAAASQPHTAPSMSATAPPESSGTLMARPAAGTGARRPLTALGSRLSSLFRRSLRSESTFSGAAAVAPPIITDGAGAAARRDGNAGGSAIPVSESIEMTQYRTAEQALLSYLPADLEWRLHQVKIPREFWKDSPDSPLNAAPAKACRPGAGRWRGVPELPEFYEINTLTVTGKKGRVAGDKDKPHLVLVHGWGGALGMWLRNLEELSEHYTVHAIDLLGWGGSSRPPFSAIHPTTSSSTSHSTALAAQAYFVDSLEAWRVAQNISTLHLVGHSMGGFISASYYLRFPHRLSNLTLLSPIGLQGFNPPPTATLRTRLQAALVHQAWQFTPQRILVHVLGKEKAKEMVMRARSRIARMFGGAESGQGRAIPPAVIVDYLLAGIHRAPGVAGEAAFAKLGSPAKGWVVPLDAQLRRALTAPASSQEGKLAEADGSVAIAYGVGDWIDPRYALWELQPSVLEQADEAARLLEVYLVEGAGHHAYVENVRVMNDIVLRRRDRVREARDEPELVAEMAQARTRGSGFMSIA